MEMVLPSSRNQEQQQGSFSMKLKQGKSELICQFQFPYQCFHLLETRVLLTETLTSTARQDKNSSLN